MAQALAGVNAFMDLIDLASARLGGAALACSDDFFAEMSNLVKPEPAVFIPGKYTERGKWMDGWESRRKRVQGSDWCIVRLGQSGRIIGVNIDTAHFNGNQPQTCTLEAAEIAPDVAPADMNSATVVWSRLVDHAPMKPSSEHLIAIDPSLSNRRFTHVRLTMHPDGGVARLRVHGVVMPNWRALSMGGEPVDLGNAANGGLVIACNDMHFGSRHNLIMPDRAANMGDGWETRRKRNLTWAGGRPVEHDWCVVRLGHRGRIKRVEVDTHHFKGNFPESCDIQVCDMPGASDERFDPERVHWSVLLTRQKLAADTKHEYGAELNSSTTDAPCTHVRLRIYPDGGVSRLRLWGRPAL